MKEKIINNMITMRFSHGVLRTKVMPYGCEIKKYRRDRDGKFAKAERSVVIDKLSFNNHLKLELESQLGLL